MKGCFVVGTDTEVGKTVAACALLRRARASGLSAAGYKPVASGAVATPDGLRNADAESLLRESSELQPPLSYQDVNPFTLEPAVAPHLAAEAAGMALDPAAMVAGAERLAGRVDRIVVEGAGGLLVPLGPDADLGDVAGRLGLPVVLVVGLKLGCINHALLTVEALAARGLTLAGWVGSARETFAAQQGNIETLQDRIAAPLLAAIGPETDPVAALAQAFPDGLF